MLTGILLGIESDLCIVQSTLKDQVQYLSMQFVMKKCFLLNPEKKFSADPSCRFREKCKTVP